ncbi:hypothetical protein TYRP_018692, partial [Tyrophagus putrescentiae]
MATNSNPMLLVNPILQQAFGNDSGLNYQPQQYQQQQMRNPQQHQMVTSTLTSASAFDPFGGSMMVSSAEALGANTTVTSSSMGVASTSFSSIGGHDDPHHLHDPLELGSLTADMGDDTDFFYDGI